MSERHGRLRQTYVDGTPHMREMGMQVTDTAPARGSMMFPARPDWLGDPVRGLVHPGPLTVLADSACGLAVGLALSEKVPYATLDLRMDYLRAASPDGDVHCEAECYRLTRNVAFARGSLWQNRRDEPIAGVLGTFMLATPSGRPTTGAAAAESGSATAAGHDWQAPVDSEPVLPLSPIPYVEFLGIRVVPDDRRPLFRLPFDPRHIGNPHLPALHGGVVAAFSETAATLHLIQTLKGVKFPKSIDFSIDYLRPGRPAECFADCEVVRIGARAALVQVRCWQKSPDYPITVSRAQFLLTPPS